MFDIFISKFSIANLKARKLTDMAGHNHQGESMVDHLQIPDAMYDERSPHRHSIHSHDIDLSDTVANFVDFVKEGRQTRHRYRHNMHTRYRGNCKTLICSFHL